MSSPRRGDPIEIGRWCLSYLLGLKKRFWFLLGWSASKNAITGALVVPFRVFRRNNKTGTGDRLLTGDNVLFWNWYLLVVKKISSHSCKTGSW